jgi:glycosyltransferase involved in cell wall biosynthesis
VSEWRTSVAVVTRNRPDSLRRMLASLRAQDVQPWEVVVSDDSDAPTVDDVRAACAAFDARYVGGPRRGLYANRNAVALACGGTHVRSMDDDHEFPPGHFRACDEAVRSDPTSVWVIGEFSTDVVDRSGPIRCPGQLHPRGFSYWPPDEQDCWAISDGASIYPRGPFDGGLRFSEAFKFGAAYLEFGSRLRWLGYRIRRLDGAYVIHHHDLAARSFMDGEMEQSARAFAMLCHSFAYQPTIRNRTLTALELVWQAVRSPTRGVRSFLRGRRAYLDRLSDPRPFGPRHQPTAEGS